MARTAASSRGEGEDDEEADRRREAPPEEGVSRMETTTLTRMGLREMLRSDHFSHQCYLVVVNEYPEAHLQALQHDLDEGLGVNSLPVLDRITLLARLQVVSHLEK
ncbi:hypothetical protein Taro_005825, partial [Colocasia esculenta]|nr:hypothetical protein [Colocasia esculenta]